MVGLTVLIGCMGQLHRLIRAAEVSAQPALDMTAESCSAAGLDRGHDAPLTEAQMSLVGSAPRSAVAAEDVRDFKSWMGHCRRINPALSS